MTHIARSNLFSAGRFACRGVATVTLAVSVQPGGNRQRDTSVQRSVTSRATALRSRGAGHVLGMIELDVETLLEDCWKTLQRRVLAIHIRVTNRAHGNRCRYELAHMTTLTSGVPGEAGLD